METKGRRRPPKYPMPERIDASPEQIAEVVLLAKPKETWRYEEESGVRIRYASLASPSCGTMPAGDNCLYGFRIRPATVAHSERRICMAT